MRPPRRIHSTAVCCPAGGAHLPGFRTCKTRWIAAAALLLALLSTPAAGRSEQEQTAIGWPAKAYDLLLVRPVGLTGMAVGAGFFAIVWPLTAPFGGDGAARAVFLEEPYRFTFRRSLGDFYDY